MAKIYIVNVIQKVSVSFEVQANSQSEAYAVYQTTGGEQINNSTNVIDEKITNIEEKKS